LLFELADDGLDNNNCRERCTRYTIRTFLLNAVLTTASVVVGGGLIASGAVAIPVAAGVAIAGLLISTLFSAYVAHRGAEAQLRESNANAAVTSGLQLALQASNLAMEALSKRVDDLEANQQTLAAQAVTGTNVATDTVDLLP
jgi:hypothetical protein